jgi:hypothetical protein
MKRLIVFTGLLATVSPTLLAGAELQPRDLSPVTWIKATRHLPVEIVRDGQARAVVYVANPRAAEPFVLERRGQRPPVLKQLVDELLETVRLSTGTTLEMIEEPPPPDRSAIVIGDCDDARRAGIDGNRSRVGFLMFWFVWTRN